MSLTKVKFKVEQTCQLEVGVLMDRILYEMKPYEYKILSKTDTSITFNDEADFSKDFKLYSKWNVAKRMHHGQFEFLDSKENRIVRLVYYRSITVEILILAFLIILTITVEDLTVLLFGVPFIIQFIFFSNLCKEDNEQMLNRIAS